MKRISLLSIFVVIALAALVFGLVASIQTSRKLAAQVEALRVSLELRNREYEQLADKQAAELELVHNSTKLLTRIHNDPEHANIVAFINEMEGDSLPCSVRLFPDAADRALFVYHEPFGEAAIASRGVHRRRSVQLVVDTDSWSIIDAVMHVGYRTESVTSIAGGANAWATHYELADGTKVNYQIRPTGFTKLR